MLDSQDAGPLASKPLDAVLEEARELAADGVRELNIVAQDTTYYGMDTDGRPRLTELLKRLEEVEGIQWIRLMYLYPRNIDDGLLTTIAQSGKIVPYLDMPLQHCNDEVLLRMRRRTTRSGSRSCWPGCGGDPQPGVADHVDRRIPGRDQGPIPGAVGVRAAAAIRAAGGLCYSVEPGTPAATMDGQHSREDPANPPRPPAGRAAGNRVCLDQRSAAGSLDVLLDGPVPEQPGAYVGRSYADAPEVDGVGVCDGRGIASGADRSL